jgi:hypothetical protein
VSSAARARWLRGSAHRTEAPHSSLARVRVYVLRGNCSVGQSRDGSAFLPISPRPRMIQARRAILLVSGRANGLRTSNTCNVPAHSASNGVYQLRGEAGNAARGTRRTQRVGQEVPPAAVSSWGSQISNQVVRLAFHSTWARRLSSLVGSTGLVGRVCRDGKA